VDEYRLPTAVIYTWGSIISYVTRSQGPSPVGTMLTTPAVCVNSEFRRAIPTRGGCWIKYLSIWQQADILAEVQWFNGSEVQGLLGWLAYLAPIIKIKSCLRKIFHISLG